MPSLARYPVGFGRDKPPVWAKLSRPRPTMPNALALAFNEGAGSLVHDVSGKNNHGTLSATDVFWGTVPGQRNKALIFNQGGGVRHGQLTFSPGIALGPTCWLAMRIYATNNSQSYCVLASDAGGFNGLNYRGITNKLDMVYSSADHQTTATLTIRREYDIVVSSNNGTMTFYINGQADATFTGFPGFTLQAVGTDTGSDFFAGYVSYLLASNGQYLSPAQVWKLYQERYNIFGAQPRRLYPSRFYGDAIATISDILASGGGTFDAPSFPGTGVGVIGDLTAAGSGSFATPPSETGDGSATISDFTVSGSGEYLLTEIRAAVRQYLVSDATLSSIVGNRVRPGVFAEEDVLPGITYTVLADKHKRGLNSFGGFSIATFVFDIRSRAEEDCVAVKRRLEDLLDGKRLVLSGVTVNWASQDDEEDFTEDPQDGSDRFYYHVKVSYRLKHAVTIPNLA